MKLSDLRPRIVHHWECEQTNSDEGVIAQRERRERAKAQGRRNRERARVREGNLAKLSNKG